MEFIGLNHIKGEMSDADFQKKIDEEAEKRKGQMKKYGRDGNVQVYEELFHYKGIPYWIRIVRYYQIGVPLNQIKGMNWLSKWAVLEHPDELKPLAEFIDDTERVTGLYEWMYRDTLHCGQENWTLKQMVEQMHREAKQCIDAIPTIRDKLTEYYEDKIERLEAVQKLMNDSLHSTKKKEGIK